MTFRRNQNIHLPDLISGLRAKNRLVLSKCITLLESKLESDRQLAANLLDQLPRDRKSLRLGITGVPGVGKSTFIEALGEHLIAEGKSLAVLTIDPSSHISKGSILGDKTRMERLSRNPHAYIRPTASGATLGGVAAATRESIQLCEAAGFDVIIVETVGVGQSEIEVKHMVDYFLLLMLAGAGDDLQGIKRGIMEIADHIVINKADGDNVKKANLARQEYEAAIHFFPPGESGWTVPVQTCSAQTPEGIDRVWSTIQEYKNHCEANGWMETNRSQQNRRWLQKELDMALRNKLLHSKGIQEKLNALEEEVTNGRISIRQAIHQLLEKL